MELPGDASAGDRGAVFPFRTKGNTRQEKGLSTGYSAGSTGGWTFFSPDGAFFS